MRALPVAALAAALALAWPAAGRAQNNSVPPPPLFVQSAMQALFGEGNRQRAKAYLLDALRADPNYKPALFNLGYIYAMEENIPEARRLLQQYVSAGGSPKLAADTQQMLRDLDNLERVNADPRARRERNYTLLILRATDYQAVGLPREALAICAKASAAEPKRYEAYYLASSLCIESKRFDDAKQFLERAIKLAPAADQLALNYQRYVIQDAIDEQTVRADVAASIKAGAYKHAEDGLRVLCGHYPDDQRLRIQLATVFAYAGQPANARLILTKIVEEKRDPAAAEEAAGLLAKLTDLDTYHRMLLDKSIQHPAVVEIEERMHQLAHEMGVKEGDAENLDNLATNLADTATNLANQGQNTASGVSQVLSLFGRIASSNKADEAANKKDQIQQLAQQRHNLRHLPRPYIVALAALQAGQLGVAEMAFEGTPAESRDPYYWYRYANERLQRKDEATAAQYFSQSYPYLATLPLDIKARASGLMLAYGVKGVSLQLANNPQVFDRKNGSPKASRDLCLFGIQDAVRAGNLKEAEWLGEKGWSTFADVEIAYALVDAYKAEPEVKKAAPKSAHLLEEVRAFQIKKKAPDQEVGNTEVMLAWAYFASKNMREAKKYAEAARAKGCVDADLMSQLGAGN